MRHAIATASLASALALVACESASVPPTALDPRPDAALGSQSASPTQAPADQISANIRNLHLGPGFPYPTIIDPRFGSDDPASPDFSTVVGYVRAGDAAIWTGHYLAAEAFRYAATRAPEALANAHAALNGIQGLVDVTADAMPDNPGLLARFLWPVGWTYGQAIADAERGHGVYDGSPGGNPHKWLGKTSRDQYSGVFFGLAAAYDAFALIAEEDTRTRSQQQVRDLVTRMLHFLLNNGWNIRMPGEVRPTETFLQRPDQRLALLQIGRHVNPDDLRIAAEYSAERASQAGAVRLPIEVECGDPHGGYYKFNLDHINLYNLIRLEEPGIARDLYMQAFATLRGCTGSHQNAHFNMIERGIEGPDAIRDGETEKFLKLWLRRARRDYPVDLSKKYQSCGGDRACRVIRIDERVNTDFLWQRSPFLLFWDHPPTGTIETAAIDYLLPDWMARYYGVITQ